MEEPSAQEKLFELEQGMEQILAQKKQFQNQILETESILSQLSEERKTFKIIGNILVEQTAKDVQSELEEKKETLNVRLQTIQRQEEQITQKIKAAQEEVLANKEK